MVRINIKLDSELHKAIRKKAIDKEISMEKIIIIALEAYLRGDENGL